LEKITFDRSHFENIGLVREAVLRRLRDGTFPNQQFYQYYETDFGGYVNFPDEGCHARFNELVDEVTWDLISQGIIMPGKVGTYDFHSANLPLFRITTYGDKVLQSQRTIPHDVAEYIAEIRDGAPTCVDHVGLGYLEEALRCFSKNCFTASALLLGIAAEAVFLRLEDVVKASLKDSNQAKALGRGSIKERTELGCGKIQLLARRDKIPPTA
jgi:hypothetical protein